MSDGAERVAIRAEDDSLVGYFIPVRDSPGWAGEAGRGAVGGYYWCKLCSWSCEWSGGSVKLLEHYEQRHRVGAGEAVSPKNLTLVRMDREREKGGRKDGSDIMASKGRKDQLSSPFTTSQGIEKKCGNMWRS